MTYKITLIESEEGWAVWCDDLPGCCSQGNTKEEAIENIKDAIQVYLETQKEIQAEEEREEDVVIHHSKVLIPAHA